MEQSSRQLAFLALRAVERGGFADVVLDRLLQQTPLSDRDRSLATELVYGSIRRQRTLDALIDQLAKKTARQQPPDLRSLLHLGFYQLRYLHQVPPSAAVDTTVELAKANGLGGLAGFVNGVLRRYGRQVEASPEDPLLLPPEPIARLGVLHSFPDWIISTWVESFGLEETERLCIWLNQPPHLDLRINPLKASRDQVETTLQSQGISTERVFPLPQALRLPPGVGNIQNLPGFGEGWWTVQDSSAQLVSHVLDPQPHEVIVDACAAPGGKTTHIAELMQDRGQVWAFDRHASRLKKVHESQRRLKLTSIHTAVRDSRSPLPLPHLVDRVLLDAPCSGLGTLHRHADARWRQTPDSVTQLAQLQQELLAQAATWVKPGGILVYATCTLHPLENEAIVTSFLSHHPQWAIDPPTVEPWMASFLTPQGWMKVLPHRHNFDGFFVARFKRSSPEPADSAV